MSILQGKNILIFQQRGWGEVMGHFLAKKLQEEGCHLATLTLKRTTDTFIRNQKDVSYEYIINNDEIMADPRAYLDGDDFTLKEICEALGVDSIWPLVYSSRNHVKSYRDKFYYGFKQNVSDEGIIVYVKALYKMVRFFFDTFQPDFILSPNLVSLPHLMFHYYGKKKGIKLIGITDGKVSGYTFFSYSHYCDEGPFFDHLRQIEEGLIISDHTQEAKEYIVNFRAKFQVPDVMQKFLQKKKISFWKKMKKIVMFPKRAIIFFLNRKDNYIQSIGVSVDYRTIYIVLRDIYCKKAYSRFAQKFAYVPLDSLSQYVYYPLQFQPEAAIDVVATYFSNQIEMIRLVAMSLPDDYTLVVKSHPAMMAYTPPSYLEKIARTPNVKLVDFRIPGEQVLKGAAMVIGPGSTTIAEAAFLKKPAIQLGDLGTTLQLPNTFRHTDMTTISARIKEVLKINLDTKEYERQLENFVAAVLDVGFAIDYFYMWEKGKGDYDELWNVYKKEIIQALSVV